MVVQLIFWICIVIYMALVNGPTNTNLSFNVTLPNSLLADYCEPQICGRIRYSAGAGQKVGLSTVYCSGDWPAFEICKKRVSLTVSIFNKSVSRLNNETAPVNFSVT